MLYQPTRVPAPSTSGLHPVARAAVSLVSELPGLLVASTPTEVSGLPPAVNSVSYPEPVICADACPNPANPYCCCDSCCPPEVVPTPSRKTWRGVAVWDDGSLADLMVHQALMTRPSTQRDAR